MNRDRVVYFDTDGGVIQGGVALSVSPSGRAHTLVAGERFIGFSAEYSNGSPSVLVSVEGFEELTVDGATTAHIGSTVFARSFSSFTIDGKTAKASQIGRIVRAWSNGKALVKYSF